MLRNALGIPTWLLHSEVSFTNSLGAPEQVWFTPRARQPLKQQISRGGTVKRDFLLVDLMVLLIHYEYKLFPGSDVRIIQMRLRAVNLIHFL